MNFFYLSYSDLRLLDDWADPQPDPKTLATILHTNGMDITRPYEAVLCTHRNLRGEVVTDYRIEGSERTDLQWRRSGAASISAYLYSTDDLFMKEDLRKMSRRSESDYFEKIRQTFDGE